MFNPEELDMEEELLPYMDRDFPKMFSASLTPY
jgi:hypothetical protein